MKLLFLSLLPILAFASCREESPKSPSAPPMKKMNKRFTGTYTGQVIEKTGLNKAGKPLANDDLYLRLSMGDFFIKFCESSISREDLKDKVDQYITVIGELKKGEWDSCPGDSQPVQSRVGEYFIITGLMD